MSSDRAVDQVGLQGRRFATAEMEAILRGVAEVRNAVVIALDSRRGGKTLVCFLEVGTISEVNRLRIVDSARRAAISSFPSCEVQVRYLPIDHLPVDRFGKPNRSALVKSIHGAHPAISTGPARVRTSYTAHELFVEALCESDLDESLTFLQHGGDSMDAIGLVSALRRVGLDVSISDLIGGQPIGEVLQIIAERPLVAEISPAPVVADRAESERDWSLERNEFTRISGSYAALGGQYGGGAVQDIWPLTPLQEGLLVQSLYDDDGPDIYVVQMRLWTRFEMEAGQFAKAVREIVARHPALRSAFVLDRADEPLQIVLRELEMQVDVVDLRMDAEETGELACWLLADRQRRFEEITWPPLFRFTLLRLGDCRTCVVFTHHHALLDGWSANTVLADLLRVYRGDVSPHDPVSSEGFSLWARRQDRSEAMHAWRRALIDGNGHRLGSRPVLPLASDMWSLEHFVTFSEEETSLIYSSAVAIGVTAATLISGAWAVALGRATERTDVTYGLVVSGRECPVPEIERAVGLLMNTVPVLVSWSHREPWVSLLTRMQSEQAGLVPYWYQPLQEIRRTVGGGAKFDTCVVFGTYPTIEQVAPEVSEMVASTSVDETTEFSLLLFVELRSVLKLRFTYWPHVVDRAVCVQIAEDVRASLRHLAYRSSVNDLGRVESSMRGAT